MKRKLAHGNCANCGVDENHTSLWRTGLDKERLCNACGLYVQTHGKSRPTSHFGGRRPRNKDKEGAASRDTTPAGTPRGTPRHSPAPPGTTDSSDEGDSSDLEPSPPHVHARPGERQSRAPRRPHQNGPSSSSVRSGSNSSRPRVKLPRAPPRPQSAPPTKHRSRFNPSSGVTDYRSSPPPAAAIASSSKASKVPVQRELAHDVLSQGQWYRVPEKTIRLDFWSKIGFDGGAPSRPTGHGGTSMMRTNSMPSYSPREALLTPDGSRTSFFSPTTSIEDSFSPAEGDFSDSENAYGKRERYYGPLFSSSQEPYSTSHHELSALDRMGHINLASSPHGTPKRRPASLLSSAPSSPRLGNAAPSATVSPSASTSLSDIKLSPERVMLAVDNDAHSAKRIRSVSPASPPTSPSHSHATPVVLASGGPSSPTSLLQHPSPLMHHNIAAHSIPRSSSPLRFSSTVVQLASTQPLPKSNLSSPALSHALPVAAPLEESAMDTDEPTPKVELKSSFPVLVGPPPVAEPASTSSQPDV